MIMTCGHVRQLHDSYVDGELSPSLTAEVHAHLLQCPECQQQVEMTRACGTVIGEDTSEPVLGSGFASRVVAELQKASPRGLGLEETRRSRRRRYWRVALSASLPAAAAVLFFGVLIWPSPPTGVAPEDVPLKIVLGHVGEAPVKAMENTKRAGYDLKGLIEISLDGARRDVEAGFRNAGGPGTTLWDVIFEPFTGLLDDTPESEPGDDPDDTDIIRF